MQRIILLADMNSFFASCHQAEEPSLRGKPVIIGGDPQRRHGIVLAASYEAKAFGIRTGMLVGEARRLCPEGIFRHPNFDLYTETAAHIRRIMLEFTPLVEIFSIDEAFLDVTGCRRLFGDPGDGLHIAQQLQERIYEEAHVPCSIGVGPNKLLAKMAAEFKKPMGLTRLGEEEVPERMWPLPVRDLFGVGSRLERQLRAWGVVTIGDLARFPLAPLRRRYGIRGEVLWRSAHGRDDSPVDPETIHQRESIGQQLTLPKDVYRREEVALVLLELADTVSSRARMKEMKGRTVGLYVRGRDFSGLYRTKSFPFFTDRSEDIQRMAMHLFDQHWSLKRPEMAVRLLGVSLGGLVRGVPEQLRLFEHGKGHAALFHAVDDIHGRYGAGALVRAASLTEESIYASRARRATPGWAPVEEEKKAPGAMRGAREGFSR